MLRERLMLSNDNEREIKVKAGTYLSAIEQYIGNDKLLRVDREANHAINQLAEPSFF